MPRLAHLALAPLALALLGAGGADPDAFKVTFLHSLSTSFGTVRLDAVNLNYDPEHRELFVSGDGPARVFNESGMEVFTFDDDPRVGGIRGVATLEGGDLLVLATGGIGGGLVRCNFRGEYLGPFEAKDVPPDFAGAHYRLLRQAGGKLYLADPGNMRVLVLDAEGHHVASWDLAKILGAEEERQDLGIRGFNVDRGGNILFTVQALFQAYVLSPDGLLQSFGTRGSAPGKFNVVSGIARDEAGYYYVADMLKSAVIVFDPTFRYVREFGYRGTAPGSLAAPEDLAVGDGKLFVSQRARQGVSVFSIARQ